MIILTAANKPFVQDRFGKISFKDVIRLTSNKARECGYEVVVFDLGHLGLGETFLVKDSSFQDRGYYKEIQKGYVSRSLFKPAIVAECLRRHRQFTVYLDGDALLSESIDEVRDDTFDVGVTLRKETELSGEWYRDHFEIVKYVNAGVIFFNYTESTLRFVERWRALTETVQNDQKALNALVCQEDYPLAGTIRVIDGVRVKYFPGVIYNNYYFDEGIPSDVKILHFKGIFRHYFPYNWKIRFYCTRIAPVLSRLRKTGSSLLGSRGDGR